MYASVVNQSAVLLVGICAEHAHVASPTAHTDGLPPSVMTEPLHVSAVVAGSKVSFWYEIGPTGASRVDSGRPWMQRNPAGQVAW